MSAFRDTVRSQHIRAKLWLAILVSLILAHAPLAGNVPNAYAEEVEVGYRDISYPSGVGANSEVTAEKPESKLWWNDGSWWASMWSTSGNAYHIYRLNWATQTWEDTGTELDDRKNTKADTLWDAGSNKLYVVSHIWNGDGQSAAAGQRGELFRYSYSNGTYTLDSGFPVEVNGAQTEALVLAKDTTGTLWITYVADAKVMVNHSIGGDDTNWGTPAVLPVGSASNVDSDDLSSIIAYNGRIGIMWSSQGGSARMYFAVHVDGAGDAASDWSLVDVYSPSGDDHMNLKSLQSDPAGTLYAIIKTSKSAALIVLLVCKGDCKTLSNWSAHTVYTGDNGSPTRPILLIDTSNRDLYIFARVKYESSKDGIYYKKSSMDNIQFQPTELGTPFIRSATETGINDPTSTKQNVSSATGLVVLASDASKRYYLHNCLPLTGASSECSAFTPQPAVSFSSATYNANEGDGSATVTVNLSAAATSAVSVNYTTGDNTALAGSDYTAASGTLTFNPAETSKTFTVPINNDSLDELDESLNLTLSNPSGATLGTPSSATLTIADNDEPPTVQFSNATSSADEGAGIATINVALSTASGLPVTVNYATGDGSASAGSDYTATNGTLTFDPGQTSQSFTVSIAEDVFDENDETVNLVLSGPTNATLGTPNNATLTILDNDPAPTAQFSSAAYSSDEGDGSVTIEVTLNAASNLLVAVDYATSDDSAVVGSDYTAVSGTFNFAPGQTIQSFTVSISDDSLDEPNEALNLILSNPTNATLGTPATATLTILDNDEPTPPPTVQLENAAYTIHEGDGTVTVNATLSAVSGFPVTVNYATSDDSASAGSDYTATGGTLTFAPGQTSQSISVPITDDTADEPDETLTLTLSDPSGATLGTPASATLTILDNDEPPPPPTVQFGNAAYTIDEGDGTATVQVTLSDAAATPVSVTYATSDDSASAGSDYTATNGTLTFAPGQTSQSFTVPVSDDTTDEPDETLTLTLSDPNGATLGTPASATLTILDNDAPSTAPTVQFENAAYTAIEDEGSVTIQVTLSSAASVPVIVNYITSDGTANAGSDYMATGGALIFAPGETSQSFTVSLTNDNLIEGDETVNLILNNPSNATLGTPANATLTVVDDDSPPTVQFSSATYAAGESDGLAFVTVTLNHKTATPVTVNYATSDGTAVADSDYTAASGTLTFAPGQASQTFSVPISDDDTDEPDETVTLSLSSPTNGSLGAQATATLTIADGDEPPSLQFSSATYSVSERSNEVTITALLSAASAFTITAEYITDDGTATADSDYVPTSGTLTFAPGQTSQSFTITILADALEEEDETVTITLQSVTNAVAGASSSATLLIQEESERPMSQLYLPLIQHNE